MMDDNFTYILHPTAVTSAEGIVMFADHLFESSGGYSIDSVAFSNNIIICGQSRKEGNIWDGRLTLVSTETSASIEKTIVSGVAAVACSSSTGNIFVGRDDGNLSIFSDSLEEVSTISAHDDIITALSVNPFNDAQCVTVSWDGQIGLLDCASSQIDIISGHSGIINSISHNNVQPGIFATIGKDSFLRLWDSRSAGKGCTSLLPMHQIGSACCWSSQSEYLIACGMEDGCIHVADVRVNAVVSSSSGQGGRVTKMLSPAVSSDPSEHVNCALISASVDKSICVQDFDLQKLSQMKRISSEQAYATDMVWAEDLAGSSVVVVSTSDGRVGVLDGKLLLSSL